MSSDVHMPVLLEPALKGLNIKQDGVYVDGTFGRGGHTAAILAQLGTGGRLIAIDRDAAAIASVSDALRKDPRFELIKGEIAELAKYVRERRLTGQVDGLLLDLGVSSPQLGDPGRGFSFLRDGPLDMRMDPETGITASAWLNSVEEKELTRVLRAFGEEAAATRIARAIVASRKHVPITRTCQLADIVASVVSARHRNQHPATKTFQAIRIAINNELDQLEAALAQSVEILRKGGRLCVITFHSLEDRIVKRFIRDASREPAQYRGMPSVPEAFRPTLKPQGKPIAATAEEVAQNVRARSARLRIAERL
jgi:16S rRNA (cytosine1402-N4)-methyltransferase